MRSIPIWIVRSAVAAAASGFVGSSVEALGNFQKTEIEKYRKIAAAAGIMPE